MWKTSVTLNALWNNDLRVNMNPIFKQKCFQYDYLHSNDSKSFNYVICCPLDISLDVVFQGGDSDYLDNIGQSQGPLCELVLFYMLRHIRSDIFSPWCFFSVSLFMTFIPSITGKVPIDKVSGIATLVYMPFAW